MSRPSRLLPDKFKQRAIAHDIPISTVYARLHKGWSLSDATTKKPLATGTSLSMVDGKIRSERPKARKVYAFNCYADVQEQFEDTVRRSGKSFSVWLADLVAATLS